MNYISSNFKLGVLGGGQLGKMLLQETRKWDVYTKVLDPSPEAPARLASNEFVQGELMDYDAVYNFGKNVNVLTIEIEHVNIDALETLEKEGVHVYPKPKTLRIIADKSKQKLFYTDHSIPTASFSRYAYTDEICDSVKNGGILLPFVWKSAQFGYDGQGVKVVRSIEDLSSLPNVPAIAETLVPFKRELAVIVCRNPKGESAHYPVVEMEFHPEANQVEYVLCPARIDEATSKKAVDIALKVAQELDSIGLLAVELFETEEGDILVNEVAPRPHNSGHYSIEASITSQYEQHLRALLDFPLGATDSIQSAVMVNLVGAEGHQGAVEYQNIEKILAEKGVTPHIYGKAQTRPFRKMGHVTIVAPDIEEARSKAAWVKKTIKVISTK